jgi:hypothetical protein
MLHRQAQISVVAPSAPVAGTGWAAPQHFSNRLPNLLAIDFDESEVSPEMIPIETFAELVFMEGVGVSIA